MAKDKYHDLVKEALIEEGWTITDDPYRIDADAKWETDLGAEKLIGAEKNNVKIAVEIKSFSKISFSNEFHGAIGQYFNYGIHLELSDSERMLYLAVPLDVWKEGFQLKSIQYSIERMKANIIIYNVKTKKIERWIPYNRK